VEQVDKAREVLAERPDEAGGNDAANRGDGPEYGPSQ
jgi:hypothetical protein